MIRVLFFICLTGSCLTVSGQSGQQPFFKVKADSLEYARLQRVLSQWAEESRLGDAGKRKEHNYDSLNKIIQTVLRRATFRYVYKPRTGFTSFSDLQSGKVNADSVIQLSISDLRSIEIPAEVLPCKNLEELELVNTRIDKIPTSLNQLQKLKAIYLFNNIPSRRLILEPNERISYLRIAGNNPEKLPSTYKNFTALDSLNLSRSGASKFPNIKKNKELVKLILIENNITLKRFKVNPTLEYLDLRRNKVAVVPNKIRKFKSLTSLSFNMNPVRKVKSGLGKLEKLEYVSFYANGISEIPKPVYQLKNLKTIDLFENKIEFVNPEIKNLQNLEVLYLANNRLYSLPEEIGSLKNLRELYVYNNRMDTLPASMDNLEKLQVLWVNDNFFHTIPATTWRVKNMSYLDASQNFIKHVPNEVGQTKLSTLILSGHLMNKERENPELFEKLRKQGTQIIYYTAASDEPDDDEF